MARSSTDLSRRTWPKKLRGPGKSLPVKKTLDRALEALGASDGRAARLTISLNQDWQFRRMETPGEAEAMPCQPADGRQWEMVNLPHSVRLEPSNASGGRNFQGICWYCRTLQLPAEWKGKTIYLHFEGAMSVAEVWLNKRKLAANYCGYLPFVVDLTPAVNFSAPENLLAVRLDNRDLPDVPPGKPQGELDFTYFGGLYRNVRLEVMDRLHIDEDVPLESKLVSRQIEGAQSRVEGHNFDARRNVVEYDDVMNKQREVVYHRRRELLSGASLKDDVLDMCDALIEEIAAAHANSEVDPAQWDWKLIDDAFFKQFKFRPGFSAQTEVGGKPVQSADDLTEIGSERVHQLYDQREAEFTEPVMRQIEKIVMLQTLDSLWKDHLLAMDHLKEGIGLRGYAQVNPLVEYQKEGFTMFEALMAVMQQDVVEKVFSVQVQRQQDVEQIQQPKPQRVVMSHGGESETPAATPVKRDAEKVGRNDPCPCGSGKKYKRCHGK